MANKLTIEDFIIKANKVHNNQYDYSNSLYVNNVTPIEIICHIHGSFKQKPSDHLRGGGKNTNRPSGCGCPKCGEESRANSRKLGREEYIRRAVNKHGNAYDYSEVNYKNMHTKIKILCSTHGWFLQKAENHLNGVGCPKCSLTISRGERKIMMILDDLNIKYITEKTFQDLYYSNKKAKLRYDFYLTDYNILLEFHGEQHYKPINIKGRVSDESEQHLIFYHIYSRDKIKEDYAESNGFIYEVIKYNEDIESRLIEILEFHR